MPAPALSEPPGAPLLSREEAAALRSELRHQGGQALDRLSAELTGPRLSNALGVAACAALGSPTPQQDPLRLAALGTSSWADPRSCPVPRP